MGEAMGLQAYARQVRAIGPVDLEMGSDLSDLREKLVAVELRDENGTPIQCCLARLAWAELSEVPGLPDLQIDLCLSVAPPAEDVEAQAERLEKAFAQVREYHPEPPGGKARGKRLSRDELLSRNRLVLEEVAQGVCQREIALRHGISPQTVSKIVIRARNAAQG